MATNWLNSLNTSDQKLFQITVSMTSSYKIFTFQKCSQLLQKSWLEPGRELCGRLEARMRLYIFITH